MGRGRQTSDWILEAKKMGRILDDLREAIRKDAEKKQEHRPLCVCYQNGCSYCRV